MARFVGERVCEFLQCVRDFEAEQQARDAWHTFLRGVGDCRELVSPTPCILDAELPVHKGATLFELCIHYGCDGLAEMVIAHGASVEHHMTRNMKQAIQEQNEPTLAFWRAVVTRWAQCPTAHVRLQRMATEMQQWTESSNCHVK